MTNADTLKITSEVLILIAEIDEFKDALFTSGLLIMSLALWRRRRRRGLAITRADRLYPIDSWIELDRLVALGPAALRLLRVRRYARFGR